jgi:hypothetical protein
METERPQGTNFVAFGFVGAHFYFGYLFIV